VLFRLKSKRWRREDENIIQPLSECCLNSRPSRRRPLPRKLSTATACEWFVKKKNNNIISDNFGERDSGKHHIASATFSVVKRRFEHTTAFDIVVALIICA
jgi:hypothetical protein